MKSSALLGISLLVCGSSFASLAATTPVTLAPNARPTAGQAAVGYVGVAGSGFPSGEIVPRDVQVTLTPPTGSAVTTSAAQVTVLTGTDEFILFQIPASIAVTSPTVYAVSIKGETTTKAKFASTNTSALTVNPPASISSVAPNAANAALTLAVTITGAYTSFVQGTTQASFGAGIAVGGGAEGQPGPVTVNSPTSATAQISIDPAAAAGAQTVTVTTGAATETLPSGFTVESPVAVTNINMTSTMPLAPGFSGFNDSYVNNAVEYWDPKYIPFVQALKPGWDRFPGGTTSMAFEWETGHVNVQWIDEIENDVNPTALAGMERAQELTQGKGGVYFSDFATFIQTVSASAGIVDFNGFTDTDVNSAENMVVAAQTAGLPITEWELCNEPYFFPDIFPTAASYASAMFAPYYTPMSTATNPPPTVGLFYQGQFAGDASVPYQPWDNGMKAYSPHYWQGVSMHYYPITNTSMATADEEETLNGVLAYGTNEYFSSYVAPLIGANTPLFLTEMDSDGYGTMPFEAYIYDAIFVAEFIARVSTVPNLQGVGVSQLYMGNNYDQGSIRAVDDYESYLIQHVKDNPNYSTDTATNPDTQFSFYYATKGLAMEIVNSAVNGSNATWPTTLTGGPTVPIEGYNNQPVPAVFAQAFQGTGGTHYLLITNKSSQPVPIGIEVNGVLGPASLTASYISSTSDTAQNTATDQNAVQIVNTTFSNPFTVGPYSVTSVQW
jgi:hypothetical protein